MARLSRRPRSRSRGLFICASPASLDRARLRRPRTRRPTSTSEPAETGCADCLELFVVQEADSPSDHAEDSAREHDPRFGVGVALGGDCSLLLATADEVCDEVVHLAHVATQMALQLGVFGSLAQGLYPELRELELRRPDRDVTLGDRLDRRAR